MLSSLCIINLKCFQLLDFPGISNLFIHMLCRSIVAISNWLSSLCHSYDQRMFLSLFIRFSGFRMMCDCCLELIERMILQFHNHYYVWWCWMLNEIIYLRQIYHPSKTALKRFKSKWMRPKWLTMAMVKTSFIELIIIHFASCIYRFLPSLYACVCVCGRRRVYVYLREISRRSLYLIIFCCCRSFDAISFLNNTFYKMNRSVSIFLIRISYTFFFLL